MITGLRIATCITILAIILAFFTSLHSQENVSPFPLSIHEEGRTIMQSNGEAFVWIGDTAWELFHRLNREEAYFYLEDRATKGFTLIQAVILAELDGLRTPNPYGEVPFHDLNPDRPNDAYFSHVDAVVDKADSLGLVMGLLPTWGDKIYSENPGEGPVVFNPENARRYGRFLGERYAEKPIIWILGGDRDVANMEVYEIWNQMALGIEEGSGGTQLMTYHPRGGSHSSWWFHHAGWLDFNMYQSGHVSMNPVYDFAAANYNLRPVKPFVDGGPAYEGISIRFWEYVDFSKTGRDRVPEGVLNEEGTIQKPDHFEEGFITDYHVRVHAYWNFLSGAAGYTYGNNAIWQMYSEDVEIAIPTLNTWKEALNDPGAVHVGLLGSLLRDRPLEKLRPDQAMIFGPNRRGPDYIAAASATDGSYGYVYLPAGQPVQLVLNRFSGDQVRMTWFNPETGLRTDGGTVPAHIISTVTPPPSEGRDPDWLLILESIE